jgi:DHA1 family bicyclomycin/chloramphenicol resistance-like MFS transporter
VTRRFLRMAIVLGLITAVGPFAIDMYLPALPSMGKSLGASPGAVQMSLMAYFIVIGICQLFYGPLSDIVGRKLPIYGGLVIFTVGSIGCALAPSIDALIGFRVIQAFGACAGMVIPRAIVRDLYTGHDATRLMSLLMLTVSISPILAPLTGSFVIGAFGWRGVFAVLTIAAVLALILAVTQLKETRHDHHRAQSTWASAFGAYRLLLRDGEFISLVLVGALGVSSFFVYLGSASFVLINYYGLSPKLFSLCFALNAASFFGFSQLTGTLTQRFGLPPVVRVAASGFALAMLSLALLFAVGVDSLLALMTPLFIGYGFLGLVIPTTAVLALEHHGAIAGTASALMGALQMIIGSAVMALAGLFANGTPKPMVFGIAACAVAAFLVTQFALRRVTVTVVSNPSTP